VVAVAVQAAVVEAVAGDLAAGLEGAVRPVVEAAELAALEVAADLVDREAELWAQAEPA